MILFICLQFILLVCPFEISDYNLNALQNEGPFIFSGSGGNQKIQIGVGLPAVSGSPTCDIDSCTVQINGRGSCSCYGDVSTTVYSEIIGGVDGFSVFTCRIDDTTYNFTTQVYCADSLYYDDTQVSLNITIYSQYGCRIIPKNDKISNNKFSSFGFVFLIILCIVLLLYFVIGIPIMVAVFKKKGIEILPFIRQIFFFFDFVKEGCLCLFCSCVKKSKYSRL